MHATIIFHMAFVLFQQAVVHFISMYFLKVLFEDKPALTKRGFHCLFPYVRRPTLFATYWWFWMLSISLIPPLHACCAVVWFHPLHL